MASPPALTMLASTCEAVSSLRILIWIELLARYPVITELSLYCGCRLTWVVLMSLASMPLALSALSTAF